MPLLWLKWHQIDSKYPTHAQGNYGGRQAVENIKFFGGEGGIRTLGEIAPTLPFQGSSFGHSDTSPLKNLNRQ